MRFKPLVFRITTTFIGIGLALLGGEMLVRFADPQPYMFPRYKFSEKYGVLLYENEDIVDALPSQYEFHYTTNQHGFRGSQSPFPVAQNGTAVLVLGDSYAFGKGVNDGEEFPAVLQRSLGPDFNVTNLAVIGFGLTQEIRTFYEFGVQLRPRIVILQFCENDPHDNLVSPVSEYRGDRFLFYDTGDVTSPRLQAFLSRSRIQTSQLYNFLRLKVLIPLYERIHQSPPAHEYDNHTSAGDRNTGTKPNTQEATGVPLQESRYIDLLKPFARELKSLEIRFVMISVNSELEKFPAIADSVVTLSQQGLLEYVDVRPWFAGVEDYGSPEGHIWGKKGHAIVGTHLAQLLVEGHHTDHLKIPRKTPIAEDRAESDRSELNCPGTVRCQQTLTEH